METFTPIWSYINENKNIAKNKLKFRNSAKQLEYFFFRSESVAHFQMRGVFLHMVPCYRKQTYLQTKQNLKKKKKKIGWRYDERVA